MDQNSKVTGWISFVTISLVAMYQTLSNDSNTENEVDKPTSNNISKLSADDDCLSLFYEKNVGKNGTGFPKIRTINGDMVSQLKTVHPEYKKLPLELYKPCVEKMIICCVDIVCQRESDKKFLLFYRRDAPASNIWWW